MWVLVSGIHSSALAVSSLAGTRRNDGDRDRDEVVEDGDDMGDDGVKGYGDESADDELGDAERGRLGMCSKGAEWVESSMMSLGAMSWGTLGRTMRSGRRLSVCRGGSEVFMLDTGRGVEVVGAHIERLARRGEKAIETGRGQRT